MANDEVLGPRKTMFVLVIVVGCFAVLWPRILSPLMLGPSQEHLKANRFDREAGCCEVIFETEVAVLELINEVCSSVVNVNGKLSPYAAAECRKTVNETCGLDIAAFLKRTENVGKTSKILVEIMKNSNSSCLKEHFGVPIWNHGSHLAQNSWMQQDILKQERSPIRGTGAHPALRERGRAIPATPPPSRGSVVMPPNVRVRTSPLSVYFELDIKPPPIPGMRPPLGSPGGPVPAPKSSVGFLMPIYTICIVVFFVYTLSKILFKRTGASPYETVSPDPQFRRRVFRDDSRSSPDKLVVTAISGLVAEVQQQMEANYAQNQQRQDVQDNHTRPYTNGNILHNSGPVHIVTSEYREPSNEKSLEPQNEKDFSPLREEPEETLESVEFLPKPDAVVEIETFADSIIDNKEQVSELIKLQTEEFNEPLERTEIKPKECTPAPESENEDNNKEGIQSIESIEEPLKLTKETNDHVRELKEVILGNENSVALKELVKDLKENTKEYTPDLEESTPIEGEVLDDNKDILEVELIQLESSAGEKEPSAESDIFKANNKEESLNLSDHINLTESDDAILTENFLQEELKALDKDKQAEKLTSELLEEAINDENMQNDAEDEQENASVKVVGMEMTAHSADGGAWQAPPAPPTMTPALQRVHEAEEVKSIFLETEIPQQSRVLVADFAEDTADRPAPTKHSPMVVSGKMTLSLIQDAPRETPEREPESTVDEFTTASAVTEDVAEKGDESSDEEIEEEIEIEEIEEEVEEEEEEELEPKKDKNGPQGTE